MAPHLHSNRPTNLEPGRLAGVFFFSYGRECSSPLVSESILRIDIIAVAVVIVGLSGSWHEAKIFQRERRSLRSLWFS